MPKESFKYTVYIINFKKDETFLSIFSYTRKLIIVTDLAGNFMYFRIFRT